ncbi:MAG: hypothetical protein ACTHU0_18640 [Kofleriaceae bacterium]
MSSSRRMLWSRSLHVLLALALSLSAGCQGCGHAIGKDAAAELSKSVTKTVDALPGIIAQIDQLLANNIGTIDAALAHQIQEVNALLKENIDGINAALQDTIDNVDAMLAARLDQIFRFASGFLQELDGVFARRITQLSFNLQSLIRTLEVSGSELLETAGFQVVRTLREGNRVVAVVVGGVVETVLIAGAIAVMLVVVVVAGIFYIRQRRTAPGDPRRLAQWQLGLGAGFFAMVFAVASLMVFVPSVRASVAAGQVTLSDEQECARVVPLAAAFVGEHRAASALSADQSRAGATLLGGLYQCMAAGSVADLRSKAREYAAAIERLIGAASRCRRNEECRTAQGEHCQVTTGLCTARCEGPQHCAAGLVCHSPDTIGVCAAPCSAASPCVAGLVCNAGQCQPPRAQSGSGSSGSSGGGRFIPGGIIDDIFVRPVLGCPGPLCPIQVCARGCGWTDPVPTGVDPSLFITPQPGTRPGTPGRIERFEISKFYEPRIRAADKLRVRAVGP